MGLNRTKYSYFCYKSVITTNCYSFTKNIQYHYCTVVHSCKILYIDNTGNACILSCITDKKAQLWIFNSTSHQESLELYNENGRNITEGQYSINKAGMYKCDSER